MVSIGIDPYPYRFSKMADKDVTSPDDLPI
jgi:hypothetical protein